MLEGFVRSAFPEAAVTVASEGPHIDIGTALPTQPDLSALSEQATPRPGETPRTQGSA